MFFRVISGFCLILVAMTTAVADWRGWFDDYGKTYQECLIVQENELLKDPEIGARGANGAYARARAICDNIWERAPKEYSKIDRSQFDCRYEWGKSGLTPEQIKQSEEWEFYTWPKIKGVPNSHVITLSCNSSNNDKPPGKVVAEFPVAGSNDITQVSSDFSASGIAYLNAGRPLSQEDQVKLSIVEFFVIDNNDAYVRK